MAETVPLFPLGTVLMPGATLPLHIFEPRYRQLTVDLVTGAVPDREFGIVAVREGFTPDDENWAPSWDATHNQNFTNYHGTEYAQEQNLQVAINRTRALGIPLFIGEWGVQTQDSGAAAFQSQMLDLFNRYGLSWARWDRS